MRAGFANVIFLIILIIGVSVFSSIQASKASNAVIQEYMPMMMKIEDLTNNFNSRSRVIYQ